MNKQRCLTIMNNLLLEFQEGELLDNVGVNRISRVLSDNMKDTEE